jgi:hypothetical protein
MIDINTIKSYLDRSFLHIDERLHWIFRALKGIGEKKRGRNECPLGLELTWAWQLPVVPPNFIAPCSFAVLPSRSPAILQYCAICDPAQCPNTVSHVRSCQKAPPITHSSLVSSYYKGISGCSNGGHVARDARSRKTNSNRWNRPT